MRGRKRSQRECSECHQPFTPTNGKQLTCSPRCGAKRSALRQQQRRVERLKLMYIRHRKPSGFMHKDRPVRCECGGQFAVDVLNDRVVEACKRCGKEAVVPVKGRRRHDQHKQLLAELTQGGIYR